MNKFFSFDVLLQTIPMPQTHRDGRTRTRRKRVIECALVSNRSRVFGFVVLLCLLFYDIESTMSNEKKETESEREYYVTSFFFALIVLRSLARVL